MTARTKSSPLLTSNRPGGFDGPRVSSFMSSLDSEGPLAVKVFELLLEDDTLDSCCCIDAMPGRRRKHGGIERKTVEMSSANHHSINVRVKCVSSEQINNKINKTNTGEGRG